MNLNINAEKKSPKHYCMIEFRCCLVCRPHQ